MWPLTQAEIKRYLLEATTRKARMSKYSDLLGLHNKSKSKVQSGPPAYDGIEKTFYNAIKVAAEKLAAKYKSVDNLCEEISINGNLSEGLIDEILGEYGPVIWSDGKSNLSANIDESEGNNGQLFYTRHPIYNNENDRQNIRTWVYCFAIERTCRNMRSAVPRPSDDAIVQTESNTTASDPDAVSVQSPRTTPSSESSRESRPLRDAHNYPAPVASMVPHICPESISTPSVMPSPKTAGVSLETRNNVTDTEANSQPSKIPGNPPLPMPFIDQASNANSGPSEDTSQSRNLRTRTKRSREQIAENKDSSSPQLGEFTGRIKRRAISRAFSDKPCSSSSTLRSEVRIDMNRDSDTNAVAATNVTAQHHHTMAPHRHNSEGIIDEVDSVVGSPRLSPVAEERGDDNEPSLIVKLKLRTQEEIRQRREYQRELAVELPSAFEISSRQPKVLENVVTLIRCIKDLDTCLSQSGSRGRHEPYQLILDQWLDLIDFYLRFRKDTNFDGDLSTWDTYWRSLETAEQIRKNQIHNAATLNIYKWSDKHKQYKTDNWSRGVIGALLGMADWRGTSTTKQGEMMRRGFIEFIEYLVKWSD